MEKSKLYTSTGDNGTTSLVGGSRVKKNSIRLEAYGTVDEFSSFLGAVLSDPVCPEDVRNTLISVQNMLFNIGGYLASEPTSPMTIQQWRLTENHIKALEQNIDTIDHLTPKISSFVLPGGAPLSAKAHIARAVCRRAERRILDLADIEPVDPLVIKYFNRLSDYLFIAARYINHILKIDEIIWRK